MDNLSEECWTQQVVAVPRYLTRNYWWAYVHPWAVAFWDRLWLVNLILLTNYRRLRDAALREFGEQRDDVLQIACVYGDLTPLLAARVAQAGGALDVSDVLPIQLENLRHKLPLPRRTRLLTMDSTKLTLEDASYDSVLLFFLLHEQPKDVRKRTLEEAFRMTKPGGKIVIVDFALPYRWNPFRYLWRIFLAIFEPFALDLWRQPIRALLPPACQGALLQEERFFGGLFQKVVVHRSP